MKIQVACDRLALRPPAPPTRWPGTRATATYCAAAEARRARSRLPPRRRVDGPRVPEEVDALRCTRDLLPVGPDDEVVVTPPRPAAVHRGASASLRGGADQRRSASRWAGGARLRLRSQEQRVVLEGESRRDLVERLVGATPTGRGDVGLNVSPRCGAASRESTRRGSPGSPSTAGPRRASRAGRAARRSCCRGCGPRVPLIREDVPTAVLRRMVRIACALRRLEALEGRGVRPP